MPPDAVTAGRSKLLFGTDEPVPDGIVAHAGPLEVVLRAGKLWHLRLNRLEVWHGVAFPYRDAHWRTPEPKLELVRSEADDDSFRIRWVGTFPTDPAIDVTLEAEGTSDGRIRYVGRAIPRGDVLTNRLGVCVMHPMAACGRAVDVEHVDGRHSASTFPTLIPPWPPFTLVRAIRHEFAPGHWARCDFSGDAFEVEDQRNNADASFKTYSRSNMAPRPYLLRRGQEVRQSVELRLEQNERCIRARAADRAVSVACSATAFALPRIGVEADTADATSDGRLLRAVESLSPRMLHVRIRANDESIDWIGVGKLLRQGRSELRLDVEVSDRCEAVTQALEALASRLHAVQIVPESIAVFPSDRAWIELVRDRFPHSAIGGGTPYFFVQLNRMENLPRLDFVTFTTSSIVHGADDEIVMLGLQSLPSMVQTLNERYPGTDIRVGPSGIAAPASPLGLSAESDGAARVPLARVDPRSTSLYGAAWLLGYVSQLAASGVEAVSMMRLTGPNGLLALGPMGESTRRPPFFLLQRLARASTGFRTTVSDPSRVASMLVNGEVGRELVVANLTSEDIDVTLEAWSTSHATVLDAESLPRFTTTHSPWHALRRTMRAGSIRLGPYAVASLVDVP